MPHFKIDTFELLEFEIPAGDKKTIVIEVPPFDCWSLQESADIQNLVLDAEKDNNTPAFYSTRIAMLYFTEDPEAKEAIEALVSRQLKAIDTIWAEQSGVSLGESEPSEGSSSDKDSE